MHRVVLWVQTVLVPTLGPLGMFLVAFMDSSFLTIPEINDLLIVTSSAAHPASAPLYVAMTTLGSLAGCSVLWWLGRRGGEPLLVKRFGAERLASTREAFKKSEVLALALPALLPPPMPFKVFVLAAGVFGLPYSRFATTLLVARGLRYSFWSVMGIRYGAEAVQLLRRIDAWFDERLPWLLALAALALLAALAVRLARRRDRVGSGAS